MSNNKTLKIIITAITAVILFLIILLTIFFYKNYFLFYKKQIQIQPKSPQTNTEIDTNKTPSPTENVPQKVPPYVF